MKNIVTIEKGDLQEVKEARGNLKYFIEYYRILPAERKFFTTLLDAEENLNKFIARFEKFDI